MHQVGRRALARHHQLDSIVEQAGHRSDGHQVTGAPFPQEDEDHRRDPDHDLHVAGRVVDQVEDVCDRAPSERLDKTRHRDVERQQGLGRDQVRIHRKENPHDDDQWPQPGTGGGTRVARENFAGGLPRRRRPAHLGSKTFRALASAVIVAGVRPT